MDASNGPTGRGIDRTPAATAGAWAAARLNLAASDARGASAAAVQLQRATAGLPWKVLAAVRPEEKEEEDSEGVPDEDDAVGRVTVADLAAEVPFRAEQLVTRDGRRVDERRETCWMAEDGIGGLAYSGKIMQPTPFTPLVAAIRDQILEETGERFDCALLNLYPEGAVACKYHTDPDLGRLWARDSVIVSVGETRRFAFRKIGAASERDAHWFRVRSGDCVFMFADCNDNWEHCVMRAEGEDNDAPRASIVFKRAISRGHGAAGSGRRAGGGKKKTFSERPGREQPRNTLGGGGRGGRGGGGGRRDRGRGGGRGGGGRGGGGRGGGGGRRGGR